MSEDIKIIKKAISEITGDMFQAGESLLMSPELSDTSYYKILSMIKSAEDGIKKIIELAEELEKYK